MKTVGVFSYPGSIDVGAEYVATQEEFSECSVFSLRPGLGLWIFHARHAPFFFSLSSSSPNADAPEAHALPSSSLSLSLSPPGGGDGSREKRTMCTSPPRIFFLNSLCAAKPHLLRSHRFDLYHNKLLAQSNSVLSHSPSSPLLLTPPGRTLPSPPQIHKKNKPTEKPARWGGKQMLPGCPKWGANPDALIDKEFKRLSENERYVDPGKERRPPPFISSSPPTIYFTRYAPRIKFERSKSKRRGVK